MENEIEVNLIDIIKHVDYNAPVNEKDVFYIKVPNPGNNPKTTIKAFRVFGYVFVVPERYLYNDYYAEGLHQPIDPNINGLYDPSYLLTNDNKSDFLKKTKLLLERIAKTDTGQSLLRGLANGLPLKDFQGDYQQAAYDNRSTVEIVKPDGRPIGDSMPCSLIIYGPTANCIENKAICRYNKKTSQLVNNGHGIISEIMFCPDIFSGLVPSDSGCSGCIPFQNYFVFDPAIGLFHEMLHALHMNYGSYIDIEYPISNQFENISAEELIMVNPSERAKIIDIIQQYDQRLKQNLDRIVDTLNEVAVMSSTLKKVYQNKYFLEHDPTSNKYSWTQEGFDQLIGLVRYSLYEKKICKELKTLSRKSYLTPPHTSFFKANILDEKTYTIDKGFNLKGGYSGQNINNPKFLELENVTTITVNICASRFKRSLTRPNLCTQIKSNKLIQIVNDDYSNYEIVHKIDDTPLIQQKAKIHKQLYFPKVNYPVNIRIPNKDIQILPVVTKAITKTYLPVNKKITVKQFSRYHVLNAQKYDKTLNVKNDRIVFINANGKDQIINQSIHDPKVFYSYFPKVNTTINKTQSFANFYLYAQWIRQLVADFKEESTLTRIQKVGEDVIQIVPYIGAAYNVGNDIAHGEFVKAFVDAGIGILLLLFPETVIPLALYDITTNLLLSRSSRAIDNKTKIIKIRNTIHNAIHMRKTYIRSYTNEMLYMWWGHVYLQVEDMMYNFSQQMENYKLSMLHNITYHGLKVLETDPTATQQAIDRLKDNFEMYIDIYIQKAMENTISMLTVSAKKYLKEEWSKNIIKKLKAYDDHALSILNLFININAKNIPHDKISRWKHKLQKTFNPSGLDQILNDKKIDNSINDIIYNLVLTQSEVHKSKILCQIEVEVNEKEGRTDIIDVTNQTKIIGTSNIGNLKTPLGRQGQCMQFQKDIAIQLQNNELLSKTSLYENFTWSFWIRHPVETNEKNAEMGDEESISIIRLIEEGDHPLGFQLVLKYGYIIFNINTLDDNHLKKHYFFAGAIADNKWHMITITYDSKKQQIYLYKDTILQQKETTQKIHKKTHDAHLEIGMVNNRNPEFFFKIEQFKAYNVFFTKEQILNLYNGYMGNYLYDHWGEPLKYNTRYYMNHIPLEGHKTLIYKPPYFSNDYVVKDLRKDEFKPTTHSTPYPKLYTGEKIEFHNLSGLYHEKTTMMSRAITKMKIVDNRIGTYIYYKDDYLVYENHDNDGRSKLFQLHALRHEIKRKSPQFNPYSIIITGTTYQGYNDGAVLNNNWYYRAHYTIERNSFKVDRNALAKPGKNPFIQSMEDENDDYINRFCWTFVPEKKDEGWKEP